MRKRAIVNVSDALIKKALGIEPRFDIVDLTFNRLTGEVSLLLSGEGLRECHELEHPLAIPIEDVQGNRLQVSADAMGDSTRLSIAAIVRGLESAYESGTVSRSLLRQAIHRLLIDEEMLQGSQNPAATSWRKVLLKG